MRLPIYILLSLSGFMYLTVNVFNEPVVESETTEFQSRQFQLSYVEKTERAFEQEREPIEPLSEAWFTANPDQEKKVSSLSVETSQEEAGTRREIKNSPELDSAEIPLENNPQSEQIVAPKRPPNVEKKQVRSRRFIPKKARKIRRERRKSRKTRALSKPKNKNVTVRKKRRSVKKKTKRLAQLKSKKKKIRKAASKTKKAPVAKPGFITIGARIYNNK